MLRTPAGISGTHKNLRSPCNLPNLFSCQISSSLACQLSRVCSYEPYSLQIHARYPKCLQPNVRCQQSLTPNIRLIGGADRDRTGGLLVANQALSQLSYSPIPQRSGVRIQGSAKSLLIPSL